MNVSGMWKGFSLETIPWNRTGSTEGQPWQPEHCELEGEGNELGVERAALGGFKSGCGQTLTTSENILPEPQGTDSLKKSKSEAGRP